MLWNSVDRHNLMYFTATVHESAQGSTDARSRTLSDFS